MSTANRAAFDWLAAYQATGGEVIRVEPEGALWLRQPRFDDPDLDREFDDRAAELLSKLSTVPGMLSAVRDLAPAVWTAPAEPEPA